VPGYANPQNLNRFSYVGNNPLRYTDPTGHMRVEEPGDKRGCSNPTYCQNGRPKPADELAKMRNNKNKSKGGGGSHDDTGPITDWILNLPGSEDFYNGAAIGFDGIAWLSDIFAAGVVTYGGVYGAGLGLPGTVVGGPAVPTVTGFAGMVVAEFYVQPILTVGNVFASLSTAATVIADTKAGNTRIEDGVFSSNVRNSFTLTAAGWVNKEAYTSLTIQSLALSNDFGWTSLPFQTNP
jgi:hypothetical protein